MGLLDLVHWMVVLQVMGCETISSVFGSGLRDGDY